MALEHSTPSAGDIGEGSSLDTEPDPDRRYEQRVESRPRPEEAED